ncbi:unnamed protein product [Caretta caretta]
MINRVALSPCCRDQCTRVSTRGEKQEQEETCPSNLGTKEKYQMPFKLPFLRGWQEGKESDVNAVTFHPCRPGFKPEFHHKRKMPADWTLLYPDVLLLCFLLTIISTNLPGKIYWSIAHQITPTAFNF